LHFFLVSPGFLYTDSDPPHSYSSEYRLWGDEIRDPYRKCFFRVLKIKFENFPFPSNERPTNTARTMEVILNYLLSAKTWHWFSLYQIPEAIAENLFPLMNFSLLTATHCHVVFRTEEERRTREETGIRDTRSLWQKGSKCVEDTTCSSGDGCGRVVDGATDDLTSEVKLQNVSLFSLSFQIFFRVVASLFSRRLNRAVFPHK
jgi:hypothetical protein